MLLSARHPQSLGPKIWRYITQLKVISPLLTGHDLKTMGYRPGPQFKIMLDDVMAATLDHQISDIDDARKLIQTRYPLGIEVAKP